MRQLTAITAAGALLLTGCAGSGADAPGPTTRTVTSTTTTTVAAATTAASTSALPLDLPYADPGTRVTIAGEPATVCIHGDGWATNIWAGNDNTSCEFVIAVHEELIRGLDATEDDIRDHLPDTVTALSPVTGQRHDLTCSQRDVLVTCRGGADAAVFFY